MILTNLILPTSDHFQSVRAENSRGVFASDGRLFKGALFGRDSLEASEDILAFDQVIPCEVLLTLAALQGLTYDSVSEEEPGKIHHEARLISEIPNEDSMRIYRELSGKWGGDDQEMVYYGSVDATPLFVRLAVRFVHQYGDLILYERVVGRDGIERTLADHLLMAKDWITERIDSSDLGFIEYKRSNPRGIENQVWKDSIEGYLHSDGSFVNFDTYPVAPLEVQGYAYDALKGINELFPGSVRQGYTKRLARRVIDSFWLEDQQMFAQAIDRDGSGGPRPVRTPSSNAGLILDSDILLDIPKSRHMVEATIAMLLGPEFLTSAGIRCRSLTHQKLIEFPDYHGSYAVWFKETSDIINGLLAHGYRSEALDLAGRIVDSVKTLGEYYEFVFVDAAGEVIHPGNQTGIFADSRCSIPEPGQTWTISAFLRSLRLLQTNEKPAVDQPV